MADNHRILAFGPPQTYAVEMLGEIPSALHGTSAAIARLRSQIRHVAPYLRTCLLIGETGTGAEAVAHALHERSRFRRQPLITLPLQEAELRFAANGRWTEFTQHMVFLPEIEKMSRSAQRSLLRLMNIRGPRAAACIAFASHDLRPLVSAGVFSERIASSLAAVQLQLPPLRERREDLPALIRLALAALASTAGSAAPCVTDDFIAAACAHSWPDNLDELEEKLAIAMQHGREELLPDHLKAALQVSPHTHVEISRPVRMVRLEQVVNEHIRAILLACHGNKLRAAEVLGISRSTLYRMLDASGDTPLRLAS